MSGGIGVQVWSVSGAKEGLTEAGDKIDGAVAVLFLLFLRCEAAIEAPTNFVDGPRT